MKTVYLLTGGMASLLAAGGITYFLGLPWQVGPLLFSLIGLALFSTGLFWHLRATERTELSARENEARYRFLAENAVDIIARHGSDGTLHYASPALTHILGYDYEKCEGLVWGDLVHPDDHAAVENALNRAGFFGGDAVVEYRLRHEEGHYVWVETRCRPVLALAAAQLTPTPKAMPSPDCFDVISVTRDISERHDYEEALRSDLDVAENANHAKSRFLANMSHELRTPLNAIIGFSEMITTQTFGPIGSEKYAEYAGLIHKSGHHLLNLINDILDLAKIEAGKFKLDREEIDIRSLVEDTAGLVQVASEKAGVTIEQLFEKDLPTLHADPRAVKQILLNLLSNAVKFTGKGDTVTVAASTDQEHYYLQVADTGIGISEPDLARLGKPFEQAEGEEAARNESGTGLGLSLVKSFAELHGGSVEIASELSVGTCVTVKLPLAITETDRPEISVVVDNAGKSEAA